ncbi:MAG: PHP domain-containing protein [Gammaproteobacteria bacterium]|nr:PHP domain-containing protein [Gammaproteobacteria bacterium]
MTKKQTISVDLHTHTIASDGSLTPTELVDLAIENNTDMLAITDHDTINGYLEIRDYAQKCNLKLISGVEISTTWSGVGIHMVGLNFNPHAQAITQLLESQTNARHKRAKTILQKLAKVNCPIHLDELKEHANTDHIGKPHIAQMMMEKGYVNSIDKAFKKYLGAGKIGDVKSGWVDLQTAADVVRNSGGIAVIAHPDKYKMTRSKLLRLIAEFSEAGGQGIEVISGKQHRDVTHKLAHLADDFNLYASIGSDFHRHFAHAANVGVLDSLPTNVTPVWEKF